MIIRHHKTENIKAGFDFCNVDYKETYSMIGNSFVVEFRNIKEIKTYK